MFGPKTVGTVLASAAFFVADGSAFVLAPTGHVRLPLLTIGFRERVAPRLSPWWSLHSVNLIQTAAQNGWRARDTDNAIEF